MPKVTAETITLAEIDRVWGIGSHTGVHGDPDIMHDATVAANRHGDFTASEQYWARARCAEILNARTGGAR